MDVALKESLQKFEKALISLENIVHKPTEADRSNIDATIQRFEFTIELFWKLLKKVLFIKGISVQYPKDVLREAFAGGLIDDQKIWIDMLNDRNQTSHTYDEDLADKIYEHIKLYAPFMRKSYNHLLQKIEE